MSQMLNINGSDDPSYRYKMPRLIGKIEGRGNGIKTVIVNASDIAQALHRPTSQVTKFFGCELGAQSRYEKDADRAIVNGAFETSLLQEKLTIYIDKFVLCSQCNNPETQQELRGKKKAALVWLHCIACGADTEADNGHKLCTAIIKEMTSAGGDAPSRKKERKQRAAARAAGGDNGDDQSLSSADQSSTADSSSVSLSVSSSSKDKKSRKDKKSKKDKKEKKSKKDKKNKKDKKSKKDKNDDDLSSVDGNGVSEAQQQLQALSIDDVAALDKAVAELRARITSESPPTAEDAVKQALLAQSGAALRKVDTIAILFFAAVADQSVDAFTPYLPGLALLAQSPAHQLEVLGCLEEAVARADDDEKRENAIKLSPVVLKALYDADVVEEDVIRGWHSGEREPEHVRTVVDAETVAALKKHTKLIVDWLATVESESEDEDDEEDQDGDAAGAAAAQDGEADVDDDDDDDDKEEVAAVEPESVFGAPAAGAESDTDSSDSD